MRFIRRCLMAAFSFLVFLGAAQAQSVKIGLTAVYSTTDSQNANILSAQIIRLTQAATIQSLSFYVKAASGQLALGLYDATGPNGGPGALKASAYVIPTTGWNTKSVTPVLLPAGAYWLAFVPSSNALTFSVTHVTGDCKYYSFQYNALPSRFSTSPASCNPTTWSFYATMTASSTSPVNGACGSSNGATLASAPTTNLCTVGTASAVSGTGPWSWSCAGSNGGTTATCSASLQAASGGTTGSSGLLSSDRNASANWKVAGMLSEGGIPNRTTVCKTLSPLGGGKDDTANIQNAIDGLPARPGRPTRSRHASPLPRAISSCSTRA